MARIQKPVYSRNLDDYLLCSQGVINIALKRQRLLRESGKPVKHIGELLVDAGEITQEELSAAIVRQRLERLGACPVFESLTKPELSSLSRYFIEVPIGAGEQFIMQDVHDPSLYILVAGKCEVYRSTPDRKRVRIAVLEPGSPIGEMGYFSNGIRTASVRALEPSLLLYAQYSDLTRYFENVPQVAHAFLRMVTERREQMQRLMDQQKTA